MLSQFFFLLTLVLFLFVSLVVNTSQAVEVVEDESQIKTTKQWVEFTPEIQRAVIRYYDNMFTKELERLGIPSFWNDEAEHTLFGDQDRFNSIVSNTYSQATTFAANQKISLDDLLPIGFLMGLGITGSETVIAGMGGSALLTLIIVPVEITIFDKDSGQSLTTYEASWAIGGLGQGALETGTGGGIAVRGALGLIWGHLPDASFLQGTAAGVGGTIAAVAGIGFKAAILFNSSSGVNAGEGEQTTNVVALATYDMGAEVRATLEAEVFYFLSQDQIKKLLPSAAITTYTGHSTVASTVLSGF